MISSSPRHLTSVGWNLHAERQYQQDGRDLADSENVVVQNLLGELMVLCGFLDSLSLESRVVCAGDQQSKASYKEQSTTNFTHRRVKFLTCLAKAANEEAEAQT